MNFNSIQSFAKTNLERMFFFSASLFKGIRLIHLFYFFIVQLIIAIAAFVVFGHIPMRKEAERISLLLDSTIVTDTKLLSDEEKNHYLELSELQRQENFLKEQLQLAKSDSIYLIVDLNDSTANLMVKGVSLFESKIHRFELSKGLKQVPEYFYNHLFTKPLTLTHEFTTIEKFPIVVKIAPKDTIEAQLTEKAPSAPALEDVFFSLEFDQSITLEIKQFEKDHVGSAKIVRQYNKQKRRKEIKNNINILTGNSISNYHYRIEIELYREDARIIYRALPVKPSILVRFR